MNSKDLTQMSLEELWTLFPISLVPPRDAWQSNYIEMEARLQRLLADYPVVRISHVGSTAIPGIWAKDIVDVLVEIAREAKPDQTGTATAADAAIAAMDNLEYTHCEQGVQRDSRYLNTIVAVLERDGFLIMSSAADRVSLNLGYTPEGFADKVYHIHLRYAGDNDELYFRDYLRDHPDAAREYERIKLELWHQYEHDRDGYTAAKGDYVRQCTEEARRLYPGRY